MIVDVNPLIGELSNVQPLEGELNLDIQHIMPTTQEKTVTPKKEQQIVVPDEGVFALSKVTVEAVTNNIDSNIIAENIKNGVEILGVKGTYEGMSPSGGSSDFEITNANYLFYGGARVNVLNELLALLGPECTDFMNMFNGCTTLTTIPFINTSNGSNFSNMFNGCTALTEIPLLDTSKGVNFGYMFNNCGALTEVPLINTSKSNNFQNMFDACASLKSIPQIDTSNGRNFSYMFRNCTQLTTIPQINTSLGTNFSNMFATTSSLSELPLLDLSSATTLTNFITKTSVIAPLTTLGGFKDLGKAYLTSRIENYGTYTLNLSKFTDLTYDSLMNVMNNLYDIATAGVKPQSLVLGPTNLAKLEATEEGRQAIILAQTKGWNVS